MNVKNAVCTCTYMRSNWLGGPHLDGFLSMRFKCVHEMFYDFKIIESESIKVLVSVREQNFQLVEVSHAWHCKASLISLPTETWNCGIVSRRKGVSKSTRVKFLK